MLYLEIIIRQKNLYMCNTYWIYFIKKKLKFSFVKPQIKVFDGSTDKALSGFDWELWKDGVCVEGPSYWHYAVRYCAYGFASMRSALGTDFGMSERFEGFKKTGYFPITMTGPAGYMLAFSDCKMKVKRSYLPPMFWLATRYGNPDFSESEHDLLQNMPVLRK